MRAIAYWLVTAALLIPVSAFSASPAEIFQARLESLVQDGYDNPDAILTTLEHPTEATPTLPGAARMTLLAEGLVAAGAGQNQRIEAALSGLAALPDDVLAAADSALIRAIRSDNSAETANAVDAAQAALRIYRSKCPSNPGCDYRSSWRTLELLARHDTRRAQSGLAMEYALAALSTARSAGDVEREAWSEAIVAELSGAQGDPATEERYLQAARRLAKQQGSAMVWARINPYEIAILSRRGDFAGARRMAKEGLILATDIRSPRLYANGQAILADLELRAREPKSALDAAEAALPVARHYSDRHLELVSLHNAALARLALGDTAAAWRTLEEVLSAVHAVGASSEESLVLREFGDALAATGDFPGALKLFHRERTLAANIATTERDTALQQLRVRFGREAQQQQLNRLEQESKLLSIQLDNRSESQKVWMGCALLLALGVCLVALTYRRVREINRELARNQASLRTLSQRDPLTGLANRLALHERAAKIDVAQGFRGALLMVDIDHFKQVNDSLGHACGDKVLVEVAHRLTDVVAKEDLLLRWGGEEFLIVSSTSEPALLHALAARILNAIAEQPVVLPGGPLRVTVSIGYSAYPLPPAQLPLDLERAINLTDMALYEAKSQGRNQALGITSVTVVNQDALRRVEADFDQAWHDNVVALHREAGPVPEILDSSHEGSSELLEY